MLGTKLLRRSLGLAGLLGLVALAACTTVERPGELAVGGEGEQLDRVRGRESTGQADAERRAVEADREEMAGSASEVDGDRDVSAVGADTPREQPDAGASAPADQRAEDAAATSAVPEGARSSACTEPVTLGVTYTADIEDAYAATGDEERGERRGDAARQTERLYQLAVDDLNSRGGIAGCEVEVVFAQFEVLGPNDYHTESEGTCRRLSEDHDVFAAHNAGDETPTFIECMARAEKPVFYENRHGLGDQHFERYRGFLYAPHVISASRRASHIDMFEAAGYFEDLGLGDKVGFLTPRTPGQQEIVHELWAPALDERGIPWTVFEFDRIERVDQASDASAQMNAAVLEFRREGVTHVMAPRTTFAVSQFFTNSAESQQYRPRYGFADRHIPGWRDAPPDGQRSGTIAISHMLSDLWPPDPNIDPDPEQWATNPPNTARERCDALYEGETEGLVPPYRWCDTLEILRTTLTDPDDISPRALLEGVEGLGTSMELATAYGGASRFGPGRYDGHTAVRVLEWSDEADDWVYASDVITVR